MQQDHPIDVPNVDPRLTVNAMNRIGSVGVMAKFWQPGHVKTRLGQSIGMDQSAALHQAFVHHLVRQLTPLASEFDLRWVIDPPHCRQQAAEWMQRWEASQWQLIDQGDGDLGARMQRWFESTLIDDPSRLPSTQSALMIGADCPLLTADDLVEAFKRLNESDVVLGPAVDGGYYLIGLKGPWRDPMRCLFDQMAWSQDDVFHVTCDRISEIGMSVSMLPEKEDIDTLDELETLRWQLDGLDDSSANPLVRLRDEIELVMSSTPVDRDGVESAEQPGKDLS